MQLVESRKRFVKPPPVVYERRLFTSIDGKPVNVSEKSLRSFFDKAARAKSPEQERELFRDKNKERFYHFYFSIARSTRLGWRSPKAQMIENRPTITRAEPPSPAAEAGLLPGFIVTQVGDESLDELLRPLAARGERQVKERSPPMRAIRSRRRRLSALQYVNVTPHTPLNHLTLSACRRSGCCITTRCSGRSRRRRKIGRARPGRPC